MSVGLGRFRASYQSEGTGPDHGKTKRRRPLAIKAEFSGTIKKGSGEISSSGKSHGIGRNTSSYYKKSSSSPLSDDLYFLFDDDFRAY